MPLRFMKTISGRISPQVRRFSGRGLAFAQNMMYTHTITVYNSRTRRFVKSISDAVNLARFGVKGHLGVREGHRSSWRSRRTVSTRRLELLDVRGGLERRGRRTATRTSSV